MFLTGRASLPAGVGRTVSPHTDRNGKPSRIAEYAAPYLRKHPRRSGFWLLGDGLNACAARILLAEAADRAIDVQYYLYHKDVSGRILTYHLLEQCARLPDTIPCRQHRRSSSTASRSCEAG